VETQIQPKRKAYTPLPFQLDFHAGRGVWTQRALIAGTGAGKTICGVAEDICWAKAFAGSVGYIFAPTYGMIKRNILSTFEKFLCKPLENHADIANFSKGDMRLDWKNGSTQWFVSLEEPERAEGPNIDYAHIDEARLVHDFATAWLVSIRRLRGSGLCQLPFSPSLWITTTPDFPNSELFKVTEDPHNKSPEMQIYRASIYDNITLTPQFIAEIVRTHTGGYAKRFILGQFAMVSGGTIPFDSTIHIREIPKENIRYIRYGVDFGWANPSAIIATAFDGDGRAYMIDEVYASQMTTNDIIDRLKHFQILYGEGPVFCDPTELQTIETIRRAGINARKYEYKREDGLRELSGRFLKAGDGRPRVFVSKRCANLISELLEYKDDVKENDHAVDAARYSLPLRVLGEVTIRRAVVR